MRIIYIYDFKEDSFFYNLESSIKGSFLKKQKKNKNIDKNLDFLSDFNIFYFFISFEFEKKKKKKKIKKSKSGSIIAKQI